MTIRVLHVAFLCAVLACASPSFVAAQQATADAPTTDTPAEATTAAPAETTTDTTDPISPGTPAPGTDAPGTPAPGVGANAGGTDGTGDDAAMPESTDGALGLLPPVDMDHIAGLGDGGDRVFFDRLTEEQERDITDRAFPLNAALWQIPEIFVCWEDDSEVFAAQRAAVEAAVTATWEAASALDFFGWSTCPPTSDGIRIAVQDVGPHVKKLGSFVNGMPEGMVLNFTYNIWSPGCQMQQEYCNRVIAVHEFGHAIGFAHEQNRPDTPGECDRVQGSMGDNISLTPWDPDSVMNYCNPLYNNGGVLSPLDVAAVQYIYGK